MSYTRSCSLHECARLSQHWHFHLSKQPCFSYIQGNISRLDHCLHVLWQVDSSVVAEDDPVAPQSPPEAGDTTAAADIPTGAGTGRSHVHLMS